MADFKADIKGMDKITKDLKQFLDAAKKDQTILNDAGDFAVQYIRGSIRARREEYKVDDVSEGWALRRARLATANPLADTYIGTKAHIVPDVKTKQGKTLALKTSGDKNTTSVSEKSNLTFTGQLLDSMTYRIAPSISKITIFFKGTHKPYKGVTGVDASETKSNSDIAAKLNSDPRFHFLKISDKLKTILRARIVSGLRRKLSNYGKLTKLLNR